MAAVSKAPQDLKKYLRHPSDVLRRIGKCITFGCNDGQLSKVSTLTRRITGRWKTIMCGVLGYRPIVEGQIYRLPLHRQTVLWGDMDSMGHVNNTKYNVWAEMARVAFVRQIGLTHDQKRSDRWAQIVTPRGIGLILKSIETTFKFPLKYPDHVSAVHRLRTRPRKGMDTLELEAIIISETQRRIAAVIKEDNAIYDYRIGKKVSLPDDMVEVLEQVWYMQREAMHQGLRDYHVNETMIRELETETWDREDAVEDLGSANGIATSTTNVIPNVVTSEASVNEAVDLLQKTSKPDPSAPEFGSLAEDDPELEAEDMYSQSKVESGLQAPGLRDSNDKKQKNKTADTRSRDIGPIRFMRTDKGGFVPSVEAMDRIARRKEARGDSAPSEDDIPVIGPPML